MDDLVTIIEQRNQIINSMDQDRQRCVLCDVAVVYFYCPVALTIETMSRGEL